MLLASPVYADYLAGLATNHNLPVAGVILGMARPERPDIIVVHMVRLFKSEDGEADKEGLAFDVEDILLMIPPGIEVVGTFVVCGNDDVVKDAIAWERVKLIYRVLRKLSADTEKHFILAHNPATKKITCKLVEGDKSNLDKNVLKPVPVEFKENAHRFVQLNAQFWLSRCSFLRSADWAGGVRGNLESTRLRDILCSGVESTLTGAMITFNGEIPSLHLSVEDVVNQSDAGGDRNSALVAEIYEQNVPIDETENAKRSKDLVQVKGCVASRLYVLPDDPIEFVESLLRQDLIKSIKQRIRRATEASHSENGVIALDDLGERMGRRIYFTIQPSNIQLFDYLDPEESEDELRERINSKLDIDVEVTDIYFDVEEDGQGALNDSAPETIGQALAGSPQSSVEATVQLGNRKIRMLVVGVLLVAIVAVVIPLLWKNAPTT